jgi:putative phage-type endonuclease
MDALEKQLSQITPQNELDWLQLRVGKFTASEIHRLMSEPKKKTETLSEAAKTYVLEKVAERLTGVPCKSVDNLATQWGHENEPLAREAFELITGKKVETVGFFPLGEDTGGSPDGTVDSGFSIIEIKCPFNSANHIDHMLIDCDEMFKADFKEYYWQMQMNMLCTGADKGYFISFDPRMPIGKKLFFREVKLNMEDRTKLIEKLADAILYLRKIMGRVGK